MRFDPSASLLSNRLVLILAQPHSPPRGEDEGQALTPTRIDDLGASTRSPSVKPLNGGVEDEARGPHESGLVGNAGHAKGESGDANSDGLRAICVGKEGR